MNLKTITVLERDDLIVIDKPAGLLSIPDREGKDTSLKQLLKNKYGEIFTVHRLDRDTSGLIVFAKNESAHRSLSMQFSSGLPGTEKIPKKIYRGLVIGSLAEKTGRIESALMEHPVQKGTMVVNRRGKPAITEFEVIENYNMFSFLQFRIFTGRTHQIRVHMKEIGHPVVCDPLYGDGKPFKVSMLKHRFKLGKEVEEERPLLNRLALHAFQLGFFDPQDQWIETEAPLPKDLRAALQQLNKWKAPKKE
jgi:23S rRNA pseudouridine1911/1915/1917 synthase